MGSRWTTKPYDMSDNIDLTSFQTSLLALSGLHADLVRADQCTPRSWDEHDKILVSAVTRYIIILLASFLEEWQRFEGFGDDINVRATLRIATPYVRRIRRWKGIASVRSAMLAHPYRSRAGAFVHPDQLLRKTQVPTSSAEVWLLGLCAVRACETAVQRHAREHDAALAAIAHIGPTMTEVGIQTTRELDEELRRLELESRSIQDAIKEI
jgi:hypothetical protein